ncbi:5-oxoprolinase subunit PxpB [Olivibacter sp. XZL3]|uniref:5-oxoprolinase subunit PxpB n=1 Tax=Olivibacter sp. XZL3 TaxID=1735116 RepID=UPI0010670CC7|nr:5-oxoprolinase subunit PxpB [Olivibacter sp. XZL3]
MIPFGTSTQPFSSSFSIHFLSENAITIEFGQKIDEATFDKVHQFNKLLNARPFEGLLCTVPAYVSLTVFYDATIVINAKNGLIGISGFERVSGYLVQLHTQMTAIEKNTRKTIRLPVCYEGKLAPDLNYVASYHNISPAEVIRLHSSVPYKVYMIGFVPGFAYLGGMNSLLETPRKAVPRKKVPAGSVGIAGAQTGIYPFPIPGGWQIIGCSPLRLFDIERPSPALLSAGDEIMFEVIDLEEFEAIKNSNSWKSLS